MSTEAKDTEETENNENNESNEEDMNNVKQLVQHEKNPSTEPILQQDGYEIVIELPRDILTAYILCQLSGVWAQYSFKTRLCIWFGLYGAYTIQFAVFASFIADLDFSNFDDGTSGESWWFNFIAIAVLFMYLWRDIIAFYNSVWVYSIFILCSMLFCIMNIYIVLGWKSRRRQKF